MPKAPAGFFNYSQRPLASRQVSSSSGTTTNVRRHVTVTSQTRDFPAPEAEDVVMGDPDDNDNSHFQSSTLNDGIETIQGLPGLRVSVKPPAAKRYANSVKFLSLFFCFFDILLTDTYNRTNPSRHGSTTFAKSTLMK